MAEHRIVVPGVVGSSPITHPINRQITTSNLSIFFYPIVAFQLVRDIIAVKEAKDMLYTVEEIAERILPIALKYQLPAVYLFGSYARGTATERSDIDLLVDTAGTNLKGLFALGALYCDLEEALEKKIDLITVSSFEQEVQMPSEIDFRSTVMKERVELYAAA